MLERTGSGVQGYPNGTYFVAHLLQYAMVVVSVVNVQAMVVPVVALLAACSTLALPMAGAQPDPEFYALQMRRLKEVLAAASAILVAGVLHMGAWLRWPAALIADKDAHEAVLGTALAITLFWGATFTLRYLMSRVYSG